MVTLTKTFELSATDQTGETDVSLEKHNKMRAVSVLLFLFFTVWWILLRPLDPEVSVRGKLIWSSSSFLLAALGGVYGLMISRYFNGRKSMLGRAVLAFTAGLFLQVFGVIAYVAYGWFEHVTIAYPSIADIGYFGSIFAYIYGIFTLARYAGVTTSFQSLARKVLVFAVPLIMFAFSYLTFLKGYEFDGSNLSKIFLDFGYPILETAYVSLALLVMLFSIKLQGGIFKKPVLFLVFALVVQYTADSFFVYQANAGTWYFAGVNDYSYALSYFIMTLAILSLGETFGKIGSASASISVTYAPDVYLSSRLVFNHILNDIIKHQAQLGGYFAWEQVKRIKGINIENDAKMEVSIVGDPRQVIDKFVYAYRDLYGDVAIQVSKDAVFDLIIKLPPEEVPESLK